MTHGQFHVYQQLIMTVVNIIYYHHHHNFFFFFDMITFLHLVFLLMNYQVTAYGKSKITWHDSRSCTCSKLEEIKADGEMKNSGINGEYNCGLMGVGVVQKIPYHESLDQIHVVFSSACVKCGLCLAIADKINKTLLTMYETISCHSYLGNTETMLETLCEDSFTGYRLREVSGKRYIGDNIPGSIVIKSTGDGLWAQNLKDKCEVILNTIGREYLFKYVRDGCKSKNTDLIDILCHGKMGASRDCRGIDICHPLI